MQTKVPKNEIKFQLINVTAEKNVLLNLFYFPSKSIKVKFFGISKRTKVKNSF